MIRKSIFLLCTFSLSFCFAQQIQVPELEKLYSNYFELPREKVFLHLNKTSFFKGEDIWFTAYLYNTKTGLPSNETTNLYCGLYDSEGKQLTKSIFYIDNGIAAGHLEIQSEYTGGNVYLKAFTNSMKNFKEDDAFIQPIHILSTPEPTIIEEVEKNYEIQLLPEGGNYLLEANNSIGFKVVDEKGKGVRIGQAQIVSSNGPIMASNILSNQHGIGKFKFHYQQNEAYSFVVEMPDGSTITKVIPKAEERGVLMSVNSLMKDKIAIALHTNSTTLQDITEKKFHLAIHRDGLLLMNSFTIDEKEKVLTFSKEKLWPGMNIVTLFDQHLKPIAERLVFNSDRIKFGNATVDVTRHNEQKDSVFLQLKLYSEHHTPTHLSMSVLPEETVVNNTQESILSTFLLRPYIKNQVEKASYYFSDTNRQISYELDNLLLVQGWSRYEWADIFANPPIEIFPNETGMNLQGRVNNASKKLSKIFLLEPTTNSQYVAAIDSTKQFQIENTIAFKNISAEAILFDINGKPYKPEIEIQALPIIEEDTLANETISKYAALVPSVNSVSGFTEDPEIIALDNVEVSAAVRQKKYNIVNGITGLKITDEKGTLSNFIRNLGFRTEMSSAGLINAFYVKGGELNPVSVIIDGIYDSSFFEKSMTTIDQIYYDRNPVKPNLPFINVISKRKSLETSATYILKNGYEPAKEYYNQMHVPYSSKAFPEHGFVHWEPSLVVGEEGVTTIKIPSSGIKNLKIFVEGIGEDGNLYSYIKTISLN